MPSIFPEITSQPIRAGGEFKTPYEWAAALAASEELVAYKDALLWIEGEEFGSREELLAKVQRIIEFQRNAQGGPPPLPIQATSAKPTGGQPAPPNDDWQTVSRPSRRPKAVLPRLNIQQLAAAIIQEALEKFTRTFSFAGPSLIISEVYPMFNKDGFTYPKLITEIRNELAKRPSPYTKFGAAPKTARYAAASGPGKGKNFNIKVQRKDPSAPQGWSAIAQIHVLWQ